METKNKIKNSKITEILKILENRVYEYGNGETAIFINNDKIVLSDEVKNLHSRISKMVVKIVEKKEIKIISWIANAIKIVEIEDKKNGVMRPHYFDETGEVDKRYQPYCELREVFEEKLLSEIENILYDVYDIDIEDFQVA